MRLLDPDQAARLARAVYQINEVSMLSETTEIRASAVECEPEFTISAPRSANSGMGGGSDHPFMSSSSGGLPGGFGRAIGATLDVFRPVESDFGYVAMGRGDWAKHMIVVTRGTMGPNKFSPDWISNYNVGVQLGHGGAPVHAGFNRIWSRFSGFVNSAVEQYTPDYVHCVGHSLGGALASLNALMLSAQHDVALYTFGAPRVGTQQFANRITRHVGNRAKRVYHPADPVPMIPLLPFLHAPLAGGIRLEASSGALIDADMHLMGSYVPKVRGKSWEQLELANSFDGDYQIDRWLVGAARSTVGNLLGSAPLLERIAAGLARLVARAVTALGAAITTGLTTLDFLAWILARGAEALANFAQELAGLVNAIFGFLGRVSGSLATLSQTALRWLLGMLYNFLANMARNAFLRLR